MSGSFLAQTTQAAYATIIPDEALQPGDPRYVPLDQVRGTRNLAELLRDRLIAHHDAGDSGSSSDHVRFLVSGHAGCGKTTELLRFVDLARAAGFATVCFDMNQEFDLLQHNLHWSHVLLETIWQIDEQLTKPPYSLTIPDDLLDAAAEWSARVVTEKTERKEMEVGLETELSAGAGLSFFAKAKAALKAHTRAGSASVKKIEQEAEKRPGALHSAVRDLVTRVTAMLIEKGYRGLVAIVDSLEKIPLRTFDHGLTSHNSLFVHAAAHLKVPPCDVVYTVPLALTASADLGLVFPSRPVLMPVVRVRHRDGKEAEHALEMMSEVATRRIAPDLLAPGVVTQLALASGGYIRDFLHLLRDSAAGFGDCVTESDARRAIAELRDVRNRTIQQELIDALDHVAEHGQLPGGPHDGDLINRLLVLEYHNDETWTALHPCVESAPRYRKAPRGRREPDNQ